MFHWLLLQGYCIKNYLNYNKTNKVKNTGRWLFWWFVRSSLLSSKILKIFFKISAEIKNNIYHGVSYSSVGGSGGVGAETEGWVRLLHPRRHAAHAPHVVRHAGVRHELGGHGRHLVVVTTHGGGEGVSTAHPHTHPHAPPSIQPCPEEVRHPSSLLLRLGRQFSVSCLNSIFLHCQGSLNLIRVIYSHNIVFWDDWGRCSTRGFNEMKQFDLVEAFHLLRDIDKTSMYQFFCRMNIACNNIWREDREQELMWEASDWLMWYQKIPLRL